MTNLATALDRSREFIRRFVVITDAQAVAIALWIAHTYALDAADITPYLAFTSPEKQAGKSLALEVVGTLVNEPWPAIRPSEAVLFRKIEADCPTLLLDEVDTIWSKQARAEDEGLRALLNAGFRRHGSTVPRCVGPTNRLQDFATFCPKALGGIGDLPDTIADRSIPIRMERKKKTDQVDRWRHRLIAKDAENLRTNMAVAVGALGALLSTQEPPSLPDELSDRAQDAWEPLLQIADTAGGDWPTQARAAALELMRARVEEPQIGTLLLTDIHTSFNGDARLSTATLINTLVDIDESPWSDWGGKPITGRRLAGLLRPYGISPHKEAGWRGYFKSDFEDAWARYTPSTQSAPNAPNATSEENPHEQPEENVADWNGNAPESGDEPPQTAESYLGYNPDEELPF